MRRLVNFAMLLCCLNRSVAATHCYPDYCRNVTKLVSTPGFQCLLTNVQKNGDCSILTTFEGFSHDPPEGAAVKFSLRAYTYKQPGVKVTAFNLSVTNPDFYGLVTRYQNLLNESESACRYVKLYGNETHPPPDEFYVSCPFSNESYESIPYRLDYLVTGERYNYSKRYIFNVPIHRFIVSPVHSDCGQEGGCANSTTPFIIIQTSHRLLIMIISTVWIPPVILYVLYHLYKLYRKGKIAMFVSFRLDTFRAIPFTTFPPCMFLEASKRREKPKCLLVYSPTRLSHINVMIELAKYLRICNINAMIDMLDVTDTTGKDPEYWCKAAFRNADVVLIATSPPAKRPAVSTIYRNTDNYLLRLVKEQNNQEQKEKRYYIVQLPYCKSDDVPEETRHFKKLCLPKELPKLVNMIHKEERVKSVSSVSDKEFLDSVKLAKLEILEKDANVGKDERETENLLTVENRADDNAMSQSFGTNIDELNLLGERSKEDEEVWTRKSSKNDISGFRIDELNL
ncbi:PREDICTED: uncharacterized protein LOC108571752 isoform X5 [Habropoda laboriosa]|uniref:uncharacterized protein LOC108571752 isoform X5 n=1 Tax=Habropoda laboriosa TaxID=597456 RepID=UPI00083DEBD0|nr:PREDICTED: uncharacterized protein LOC108571752 isoform X5 [Habropoda laboriosa]